MGIRRVMAPISNANWATDEGNGLVETGLTITLAIVYGPDLGQREVETLAIFMYY